MDAASLLHIESRHQAIRIVTCSAPPVNLIVPQLVRELHDLVQAFSNDESVKVVIFRSGIEGFFLNHFNLSQAADFPILDTPEQTPVWVDLVLRLSHAPFVSIASIRGRTRGGGNEFALACDLRYASTEKAFFGQPEVGTGILPGGGGSERLPRLIGRDRAIEAILSSADYDATTAAAFGWVTRALPDSELDTFVDQLADRLAGFERQALIGAKTQINRATLPPEADLRAAYAEYTASLSWPAVRVRLPRLGKLVAEHGADVELRLGHYLGLLGDVSA
ncbi:MAG: hypothetical protein RLZZ215_2706 [Pseudomonadota bacterium]|jgi:enoyl-CoA hydratase/carnithine racemase